LEDNCGQQIVLCRSIASRSRLLLHARLPLAQAETALTSPPPPPWRPLLRFQVVHSLTLTVANRRTHLSGWKNANMNCLIPNCAGGVSSACSHTLVIRPGRTCFHDARRPGQKCGCKRRLCVASAVIAIGSAALSLIIDDCDTSPES